jgi:hypothetical protein
VVEAALSPTRARRGLLIVWLLLGALVLGIVVIELTEHLGANSAGGGEDARMLLPVPVGELGAIEIAEAGRLHRFERDSTGTWFYHGVHTGAQPAHTHDPDPARAERIERAFAAFGRTRVERDFVLDREGTAYGVTAPEILVLVYRPNQSQPLAQYAVGHVAPDTVSRYVLAVGSRTVVTIPTYQVDNLVVLIRAVAGPSGPEPSSADRR